MFTVRSSEKLVQQLNELAVECGLLRKSASDPNQPVVSQG